MPCAGRRTRDRSRASCRRTRPACRGRSHRSASAGSHDFNVEDKALTETIRSGQAAIFGEDVAIFESQQRNLTEQPNRHLMRLNIDMGGFESRRILERLVAEEKNDLLREPGSAG